MISNLSPAFASAGSLTLRTKSSLSFEPNVLFKASVLFQSAFETVCEPVNSPATSEPLSIDSIFAPFVAVNFASTVATSAFLM